MDITNSKKASLNIESAIQSNFDNIELRASNWKFIKYVLTRVKFFRFSVVKNILCELTNKTARRNIKNRDKLCGIFCILAVSYSPTENTSTAGNFKKYIPEFNTNGFVITDGLKIDDLENL